MGLASLPCPSSSDTRFLQTPSGQKRTKVIRRQPTGLQMGRFQEQKALPAG
jgi:hypothetical protein